MKKKIVAMLLIACMSISAAACGKSEEPKEKVKTEAQKDGSMLMYRDSFGESLLPFVADEIGQGYFSRLVPYNLTQI